MADKTVHSDSSDSEKTGENTPQEDSNAPSETSTSNANTFKNDGSFLEMFKKKLEEENRRKQSESSCSSSSQSHEVKVPVSVEKNSATNDDTTKLNRLKDESGETETSTNSDKSEETKPVKPQETAAKKKYSLLSHVGKRPGGKLTLKTGQVKKPKQNDQASAPKDAWSKYMSEVEKYKAHVCSDDDAKVRPLVK
ncbi:uncharacterized protein [Amphiura filiformis]|uniref:uncharacterized protein n=1 Tax=Amphiura filiformis TaxID=82378 RepID=UPI003B219372